MNPPREPHPISGTWAGAAGMWSRTNGHIAVSRRVSASTPLLLCQAADLDKVRGAPRLSDCVNDAAHVVVPTSHATAAAMSGRRSTRTLVKPAARSHCVASLVVNPRQSAVTADRQDTPVRQQRGGEVGAAVVHAPGRGPRVRRGVVDLGGPVIVTAGDQDPAVGQPHRDVVRARRGQLAGPPGSGLARQDGQPPQCSRVRAVGVREPALTRHPSRYRCPKRTICCQVKATMKINRVGSFTGPAHCPTVAAMA